MDEDPAPSGVHVHDEEGEEVGVRLCKIKGGPTRVPRIRAVKVPL